MAAAQQPPWANLHGTKRIMSEFKYLTKQLAAKQLAQVHDLQLHGESTHCWRFKLKDFDDDVPGGKQLNQDLRDLQAKYGMDHLLMEVTFPTDYPHQPFFLRVVKPRCCWYTGHVTAGGSICIEALTLSGTPGSWQPSFCVEALLTAVITNMVDCESVHVTTASGPGGRSGPLRIDLQGKYSHPMQEYSEAEAKAAFSRQQQHHKVNGWDSGGGAGAGPSGGRPAAAAGPSGTSGPALASPSRRAAKTAGPTSPGRHTAPISPPQASRIKRRRDAAAAAASGQLYGQAAGSGIVGAAQGQGVVLLASATALGGNTASGGADTAGRPKASTSAAAPEIDLTWSDDDDNASAAHPFTTTPGGGQGRRGNGKKPCSGENGSAAKRRGGQPSVGLDDDVVVVGRVAAAPPRAPVVELLEDDDPVAAEVEALRARCQALQEQLQRGTTNAAPLLAPLPSRWEPMDPDEHATVKYVELPLPGGYGHASVAGNGGAPVCQASLEVLKFNGVPEVDGIAALQECSNDLQSVLAFYFESMRKGSTAAAALAKRRAEVDTRRSALQAECSAVVSLWAEQMGAAAGRGASSSSAAQRIKRVERVQNWRLYTKYHMRQRELEAAGSVNEHKLWHGSPALANFTAICENGFDCRLSSLSGALGAGTYFAANASYSHQYSARTAQNAGHGLMTSGYAAGYTTVGHGTTAGVGYVAVSGMPGFTALNNKLQALAGHPKPSRKSKSSGGGAKTKKSQQQGTYEFAGSHAMLLCLVSLGRISVGNPALRLPPKGFDSVSQSGQQKPTAQDIFAVFDNAQAYPAYIIHYD